MPTVRYVEIDPADGSIQATMDAGIPNPTAIYATKALIEARGRKMIPIPEDDDMPDPLFKKWNAETDAFEDIPGDPVIEWTEKYAAAQAEVAALEANRPDGAELPVAEEKI